MPRALTGTYDPLDASGPSYIPSARDLMWYAQGRGYTGDREFAPGFIAGGRDASGRLLSPDELTGYGRNFNLQQTYDLQRVLGTRAGAQFGVDPGLLTVGMNLAELDPAAWDNIGQANQYFLDQDDDFFDKLGPYVPALVTAAAGGIIAGGMAGGGLAGGEVLSGMDLAADAGSMFSGNGALSSGAGGFVSDAGANLATAASGGGSLATGSAEQGLFELLKKYGLAPTKGNSLFNIGSGLYGLYRGNQMQKLAEAAMKNDNPFGPERAHYAGLLRKLYENPKSIVKMPGYQAGIDAVTRKMASQGYLGSGNMMAALQKYGGDFFNAEAARLAQLAGAQFSPNSGASIQGQNYSNDLVSKALASIGYGLRGFDDIFGRV